MITHSLFYYITLINFYRKQLEYFVKNLVKIMSNQQRVQLYVYDLSRGMAAGE